MLEYVLQIQLSGERTPLVFSVVLSEAQIQDCLLDINSWDIGPLKIYSCDVGALNSWHQYS